MASLLASPRTALPRFDRGVVSALLTCVFLLLGLAATHAAAAGTLDRKTLEAIFPPPFSVGEMHPDLPVWPIHRREGGAMVLHAQVFESIDIAPVRGYAGKPVNLLIALRPDGKLIDVRILAHSEPMFRSESGTATLNDFARQYVDLSAGHSVHLSGPKAERSVQETTATVHGVLHGTVTALAMQRSILDSAVEIAAMQLAFDDKQRGGSGARRDAHAPKRGRDEHFERMSWLQLVDAGLVQRIALNNNQLQLEFRGTPGESLDPEGLLQAGSVIGRNTANSSAVEAWVAPLGLPHVGRNLLDDTAWRQVRVLREQGQAVMLLLARGRYEFDDGRGPTHRRQVNLSLKQNGTTIALEPFNADFRLTGARAGRTKDAQFKFYRTAAGVPFDPLQPFSIELSVIRRVADDAPVAAAIPLSREFRLADAERWRPRIEDPPWLPNWREHATDLTVLGVALAVLAAVLALPRRIATPRLLPWFRNAWLLFTLVFIGWLGQGQLSVVNATSLIESLRAGDDGSFLLSDPMTVVLWLFTGVTLFVWGRGTFCGWLCPFGALQELVSVIGRRFGIRPRRLPMALDQRLKRIKYLVLAVLLGSATLGLAATDTMAEIEPFKTTISLMFDRSWPYVLWAVACIAATLFVYRSYCRYLCPLGAGLALLGRVRRFAWIARRAECGTPCQTCRHSCEYQAIAPSGKVDYDECFQCLDCVEIYQNDKQCLPLVRDARGKTGAPVIPILPVAVGAELARERT